MPGYQDGRREVRNFMTHDNGRAEPREPDDEADLVSQYLQQVSHTELLTAEEEVDLAKRIEAGIYAARLLERDGSLTESRRADLREVARDGELAKDHMVRANLRLVVSVAKKYAWSDLSFLDRIQEGNLGLIRAVEKFDYKKGYKFSTYAMWWIRQAIQRGIHGSSRTIRLPSHVMEEVNKVRKAQAALESRLGREPTAQEVAEEAGLDENRTVELRHLARPAISLHTPLGLDGDASIGDLIPDPHGEQAIDHTERQALLEELRGVLDTLPPREALIISLRYGLHDGREHSLREIAEQVGLTLERIRQLEKQSLAELRDPDRNYPLLTWAG